jgi:hypothetical protein
VVELDVPADLDLVEGLRALDSLYLVLEDPEQGIVGRLALSVVPPSSAKTARLGCGWRGSQGHRAPHHPAVNSGRAVPDGELTCQLVGATRWDDVTPDRGCAAAPGRADLHMHPLSTLVSGTVIPGWLRTRLDGDPHLGNTRDCQA